MTQSPQDSENAAARPVGISRRLKSAFSWAILVVTVAAVARQVHLTMSQMDRGLPAIRLVPLAGAVIVYAVGWCLLAIPWLVFLRFDNAPWKWNAALRTYLLSHLGKYVPGKAMVVLIRCNQRPAEVPLRTPIVVTVHETLFAMASAAVTACICLGALTMSETGKLVLLNRPEIPIGVAGLAAVFVVASSPLVFKRLVRTVERKYRLTHVDEPAKSEWPSFAVALGGGIVSWFVQGMSYFLVFTALDADSERLGTFAVATAAFSMSVVLGFLSMVPGQIGVREWAMIEMVTPFVPNKSIAVFAPLLHRLVTLSTEVIVGAVLAAWRRR